jgi:hypothetical protein
MAQPAADSHILRHPTCRGGPYPLRLSPALANSCAAPAASSPTRRSRLVQHRRGKRREARATPAVIPPTPALPRHPRRCAVHAPSGTSPRPASPMRVVPRAPRARPCTLPTPFCACPQRWQPAPVLDCRPSTGRHQRERRARSGRRPQLLAVPATPQPLIPRPAPGPAQTGRKSSWS